MLRSQWVRALCICHRTGQRLDIEVEFPQTLTRVSREEMGSQHGLGFTNIWHAVLSALAKERMEGNGRVVSKVAKGDV